ncbi:MAG: hypothetical protein U0271_34465 [Polyangiaceae bacterium]
MAREFDLVVRGPIEVDVPGRGVKAGLLVASLGAIAAFALVGRSSFAFMVSTAIAFIAGLASQQRRAARFAGASRRSRRARTASGGAGITRAPSSCGAAGERARSLRARSGAWHVRDEGRVVLLFDRTTRVSIGVRDDSVAEELLAWVGREHATHFVLPTQPSYSRAVEGIVLAIAGLMFSLLSCAFAFQVLAVTHLPPSGAILLLSAAFFGPLALALKWAAGLGAPVEVVVGDDGLLVFRKRSRGKVERLAERRDVFIPITDIREIELVDDGVAIRRATDSFVVQTTEPLALADALRTAVERKGRAQSQVDESTALRLQRGPRDLETWSSELVRLGEREHYRLSRLDSGALLSVVESGSRPPDERVGAAWVLGRRAEEQDLVRVRIAASRTAHPALRRALEDAAEGKLLVSSEPPDASSSDIDDEAEAEQAALDEART